MGVGNTKLDCARPGWDSAYEVKLSALARISLVDLLDLDLPPPLV